jgi:hypothetical protein
MNGDQPCGAGCWDAQRYLVEVIGRQQQNLLFNSAGTCSAFEMLLPLRMKVRKWQLSMTDSGLACQSAGLVVEPSERAVFGTNVRRYQCLKGVLHGNQTS